MKAPQSPKGLQFSYPPHTQVLSAHNVYPIGQTHGLGHSI